jgi:transposase InsO family protein
MEAEIKRRLRWIELYEQTGNAGLVCLKCGISRPTLRLWWRRYQEQGAEGLGSRSSRPHHSPAKKTFDAQEQWIAQLRKRRIGARRIQNELRRQHECSLALATIHKVLVRQQHPPLRVSRRPRHSIQRYVKEVPGERVQMDTCKIKPGLYQYTAVDDCTRIRVLGLYSRRTAANTLSFLERVNEEMPFPIQRIQTDRGREFFAYVFQEQLMSWGIKFRPIKPRSPHLNGKVERSQKTDWEEFYSTVDLASTDLENKLEEWQDYYNQERPHGSLKGRTPWERWFELLHQTPYRDEVEALYDSSRERLQHQNYRLDLQLRKLKEGL